MFSEVPGSLRRDKGIQQAIIVLQRITSLDNHIRLITPQGNCHWVFFYHIEIIAKNVEFYNFVDYYNMKALDELCNIISSSKGLRSLYIQVTADISNAETREREIRPYFKLNDQVLKLLVVNKPIKETMDENGFTIIGIADFLIRYIK